METVRFDELDLYPQVLRAIKEMGFEEATPIQSQAIPVVMSGVDVIGQAQTGTGKTASFGIPVLHKVDPNNKKTQVIILSPTRELAIQVSEEIRKLSKIYAWRENPSGIRRTGYQPSDQGIKRRCTDHYRYTGTCHGSSSQKNDPLRGSQYDRFRRGGRDAEHGIP